MNWKQGLFRVWLVLLPVPGVFFAYMKLTDSGSARFLAYNFFGFTAPPWVAYVWLFTVMTLTIAIASVVLYLIGWWIWKGFNPDDESSLLG